RSRLFCCTDPALGGRTAAGQENFSSGLPWRKSHGKVIYTKPLAASQTSAVFVNDGTFEEPMEYPQGATIICVRRLQAHLGSGIQHPGMRHPHYTAGSQKRLNGTGGGFSLRWLAGPAAPAAGPFPYPFSPFSHFPNNSSSLFCCLLCLSKARRWRNRFFS